MDVDGKVTQRYTFGPYGNLEYAEGNSDNRYLFQGKELDLESGDYYFGARYYDAEAGRWLGRDKKEQFFSSYNAFGNNPMKYVDPDGNYGMNSIMAFLVATAPVWSTWMASLQADVTTADDVHELTTSLQDGNYGEAAFAGGMAAFPWLTVKGGKIALKALEELPLQKIQKELKIVGENLPKGKIKKSLKDVTPNKVLSKSELTEATSKSIKQIDTKEVSKRLGMSVKKYHKKKKEILQDFKTEMKKINATNPDIITNDKGNVVLKNTKTGKTIETDVPLEAYKGMD